MKYSLLFATLFTVFTIANHADARDRSHSGGYVTGKGKTGTYSTTQSGKLKTGVTKNKSITTSGGKTYGHTVQQQYNKETGEFNKTVTNAKGKSVTYNGVAKGGVRSGTYTTNDGKTGTFDQTVSKSDNGVSKTTNLTTSSGQQVGTSSVSTYDKETNTINKSVTGPKGKTHSGSVTVTPDKQ
jgi:hypothetical protein